MAPDLVCHPWATRLGVAPLPVAALILALSAPTAADPARRCPIGPGANCAGADLSGLDLRFADLRQADLQGADLTGTDLENADLRGAKLDGARMIGTDLADAQGQGASLRRAQLRDCDLESANFSGADFSHALLEGSDLESADLSEAVLVGVSARGADMESADLRGSRADGADFTGANLSRARLSQASLVGARLRAANLSSSRLDGANLAGADLRRAHLGLRLPPAARTAAQTPDQTPALSAPQPGSPCFPLADCEPGSRTTASDDLGIGALLVDTNLSGTDLREADLNGVVMLRGSLRRAQLEGAITTGARLIDVDSSGAVCPAGGRAEGSSCPGLEVPTGSRRSEALARVRWLSGLPWPWD